MVFIININDILLVQDKPAMTVSTGKTITLKSCIKY